MVDRPVVKATLHRLAGKRMVTGYVLGYPVVEVVNLETTMTLTASSKEELAFMVEMASVDGWRNGRAK